MGSLEVADLVSGSLALYRLAQGLIDPRLPSSAKKLRPAFGGGKTLPLSLLRFRLFGWRFHVYSTDRRQGIHPIPFLMGCRMSVSLG
jgi:hypothetical protein